jgi:gamma-glutamylcyclotransferase (GGCT)/AIG2-like uncharacterized protein YtfP
MSAIDSSDGPEQRPIFVYGFFIYLLMTGSLLNQKVYHKVTSKQPEILFSQATLLGFKRRRVKNKPYPACIPSLDASVSGLLINASADERLNIDRFESNYYKRVTEDVLVGNEKIRADLYVWNRDFEELDLEGSDWSFEEFMASRANQIFHVSFQDPEDSA